MSLLYGAGDEARTRDILLGKVFWWIKNSIKSIFFALWIKSKKYEFTYKMDTRWTQILPKSHAINLFSNFNESIVTEILKQYN